MDVIATVETKDAPRVRAVRTYAPDGSFRVSQSKVQHEELLKIYVNDILTMQVGCSAGNLVELVVGRLFTEGLVGGVDEIDCLSICEKSMQATVYLNDRTANLAQREVETVPTCCTTNRTFNGYFRRGEELAKVEPVAWDLDLLFEVARDFAADTEQHRATNGTHSCRLANADGVRICCEDIGRHNALDKAIGAALIDGVDLRGCLAYTSGRVPVDMVLKAVRAGLPVLASKTVATDRAIELACAYDLTLLTRATPHAVDVLNDPWNERLEAVSHIA